MPATIIVGTQWGDEGKGKIIDLLAREATWTVRYQGGANAGHTVKRGDESFSLHLLPSGAVRQNVTCGLAWGMVIDPEQLMKEVVALESRGISIRSRLKISTRASLVLPHHVARDSMEESRRPNAAIGTTGRGIGPAYEDRVGRRSLLMAALLDPNGEERLKQAQDAGIRRITQGTGGDRAMEWYVTPKDWQRWAEFLSPLLCDVSRELDAALREGENVLLEGAQGTHLDVYAGTYPFVTSSSTIAGAACTGVGLGPSRINRVVGVVKAYTTRVGNGPFPTEDLGEAGEWLRASGKEFGTTTGRPRRCGWLDIPLLRASCLWSGVSELAVTKLDVLGGRPTIPVAVSYRVNGEEDTFPPHSPDALQNVEPVYEDWPGWEPGEGPFKKLEDLPKGMREYLQRLATAVAVPITTVSIGPERSASIRCRIEP